MRVLFAGQVPKDPSYAEANEDAFELAAEQGRIALSDGASESFDSKTWADLLVTRFVHEPGLGHEWLSRLVSEYLSHFDVANLSWSKQAAFERGSFATLLGVESFPNHASVDVLSVGDSLAVLLDGYTFVDSYPYARSEEFQKRPELFCTSAAHNAFFYSTDFFSNHHKTWELSDKKLPTLLCMTDALGEWALRNAQDGNPKWQLLCAIDERSQLEALVLNERANKNIRIDDVTLVRVEFVGADKDELPNT